MGLESAGKSLKLAMVAVEVAYRNARWKKISGKVRPIYSNMRFADNFYQHVTVELGIPIFYWVNLDDLIKVDNADIFIDEIGAIFPNDGWKDTPLESRRFFAQHRKRGIEIYANTQDFAMIDINARRMMSHVYHATKIFGSRDISATKPPPKFVFGLIAVTEIENFRTALTASERKFIAGFPNFFWLDRDLVDIYDTTEDIKGAGYAPMRHIVRYCERHGLDDDGCDVIKLEHK